PSARGALSDVSGHADLRRNDHHWRLVGLCGRHRYKSGWTDSAAGAGAHETQDTHMEALRRPLEATNGHSLPAQFQGRNGTRPPIRLHRAVSLVTRVLLAEGHRLGAAAVREDRSR